MERLKILVVEGCSEEILVQNEAIGLAFSSEIYAGSLKLNSPDAQISIAYPYAPHRNSKALDLDEFDGFALTGSSVAWGAEEVEAKPYLKFLDKVLGTGKPVLGSCWGMQTVAVLLGGMSGPNPKGSEIGLARDISLTEQGKRHILFRGMPERFSSPSFHRDHVTRLPAGAILLASNPVSHVQAMAYRNFGIDYMGFQFHPEIPLEHFRSEHQKRSQLPGTIIELRDFPDVVPDEVADPILRTRPLANWLDHVLLCKADNRLSA